MATINLEEAQAHLEKLIDQLPAGEEIIIIRHGQPVAKLIKQEKPRRPLRQLGTLKGTVLYLAPDFDAPLENFNEYMS